MARYERDGFLPLPNYLSSEQIDALKQRMAQIIAVAEPPSLSVFTTDEEKQANDSDDYFLDSGDKLRCFFEEKAFDKSGRLRVDKASGINKVGHALHELEPVFSKASYSPKLHHIATALGMQQPVILQSQYIFKQASIGGYVRPHVDATFLYTEPQSCLGVWMALEDADMENGCLYALPGSHKTHPLYQRFVRKGKGTTFVNLESEPPNYKKSAMIPLEVKQGDAVLLHGLLVHSSHENTSNRSRNAYVLHLIDGASHYPNDNWLRGNTAYRKGMWELGAS